MSEELKPVKCGCGGEAEVFHVAPEGYAGSYCVRCVKCLTQSPFFTGNKEKAIETWNRAMGERTAKVIEHDASITDTDGYKYQRSEYLCGACKKKVIGGDEYCSHCGVRLEWSDDE